MPNIPSHHYADYNLGPVSIKRPSYLRMAISMLKIRRPLGRLIFNMGIAIPGKTVFLIETAPWTARTRFRWYRCLTPLVYFYNINALRWRHNELDVVSDHQPHDCLFNRLFGRRSKKTSKLRVTGLCVWKSPGTCEFPAQKASNAENVSIWWRHHESSVWPDPPRISGPRWMQMWCGCRTLCGINQMWHSVWYYQGSQHWYVTRNCSKLRKIHSGQGHTSLPNDFSSKFKYVKPLFFLSFIFKSTDRYKIFHMTHSWQLCCCSMRQICCGLMIRN